MAEEIKFDFADPQFSKFLQGLHLFKELSEEEIRALAPVIKKYWYSPKELIFTEGDKGDSFYIIEQGVCALEKARRVLKTLTRGEMFGEIAMIDKQPRTSTFRALQTTVLLSMRQEDLLNENLVPLKTQVKIYQALGRLLSSYIREEDTLYREMDVLLFQDGGCAPGYNPVTAFVTQYLEQIDRRVCMAAQGFKSIVSNTTRDYRYLVHNSLVYKSLEKISGVVFAPPLREARGANFRTERYKEFLKPEIQQQAAKNIMARNVKVLVGIGGNGTFAGTQELSKLLPETVQIFFIPVTIDSDVAGTECIGEHTGVEIGAEKIRCYMADGRTHNRCYIIEMMGADGGYHALHSCLGAGAHLAVLPSSRYDMKRVADALKDRDYTVIVIAEGYKKDERKKKGHTGNAAEYFRDELLEAGLKTSQRIICEPFSRDIRGALPNNRDITLSQRMARKLSELVLSKQTKMMPAVLAGREYSIHFDQIRTNNYVESDLAILANRLGV